MSGKAYGIVLHLALLALCGVTLVLAQQNRRFQGMLNPALPPVEVGYQAVAVDVTHLDGTPETIVWETAERDHLLLIFTTTCPACRENQENWQTLHQRMNNDLDIIGVSLDPTGATATYRNEKNLPFEIASAADRDAFLEAFDIASVPFTIHVSKDGMVRGAWRGVLSSDHMAQIEAIANSRHG